MGQDEKKLLHRFIKSGTIVWISVSKDQRELLPLGLVSESEVKIPTNIFRELSERRPGVIVGT